MVSGEQKCPAEAIKVESKDLVEWVKINREFSQNWPKITKRKEPLPEADSMNGIQNKFEQFISKVR